RLDLQGMGEMDEKRLGAQGDRNSQHALERRAEPVEARVGAGEAVDPPARDPAWDTDQCPSIRDRRLGRGTRRHSASAILASQVSMALPRCGPWRRKYPKL